MTTNSHVHFKDSTSQAALFETMILAAAADGRVERVEVGEIYRQVFNRPEFHGIHADDLKKAKQFLLSSGARRQRLPSLNAARDAR